MWRRTSVALLVLLGLAWPGIVAAQTSTPAPAEDGTTVRIDDFAFDPANVDVSVGQSVTWVFGSDPEQHTVTPADEGAFADSGQLFTGDVHVVRFETPGTFDYLCTLHPFMTGTVTVTEATGPSATAATASPTTRSPGPTADASAAPTAGSASAAATPGPAPADDAAGGGGPIVLVVAALAALALAGALGFVRGRRSGHDATPPAGSSTPDV